MFKKPRLCHTSSFRAGTAAFFTLTVASQAVPAATDRQLDAHDHGHAQINVAISGREVLAELITPAVNVIGFEHVPETQQQEKVLNDAVEILANGDALLVFNADAECTLQESDVESELLADGGHDDHDDDEPHGDEEHDHGNDDKHDDHDEHQHEDEKHDEHDHDGENEHEHEGEDHHNEEKRDNHDGDGKHESHDEDHHDREGHGDHEESHSEFHVTWSFSCAHPERLSSVRVQLFNSFAGFEDIDVSVAGESTQSSFELSPNQFRIEL